MMLDPHEIRAVVEGEHSDPFAVLGPHRVQTPDGAAMAVRAILPGAAAVRVLLADAPPALMERLHPVGFFETVLSDRRDPFAYRLEVTRNGHITEIDDPYRFPSLLSDFDRHLLAEGTHHRAHEKLGAHPATLDGVTGVAFAVWAPSARRVSVVGDFNDWDGRSHPMRLHPANGIWEIFVPGLGEAERYKFEIRGRSAEPLALKSDPYALAFEAETPRTASVVANLDNFRWRDEAWLAERALRHPVREPLSIYEVHLGSWRRVPEQGERFLDYRELADQLADYVDEMGFTHVELLPVMEHPFYGSWGYQTIGYFAPTRRYGSPQDFMSFVDHLHHRGIGVILDWVPAHFPRDAHGLVYFDGTHLYEHADPRQRSTPTGARSSSTMAATRLRTFLLDSALFWLDHYHADGLRVDAVATMLYLDYSRKPGEWVPNRYGGRENLDADRLPPPVQRSRVRRLSRRASSPRGVHLVADGVASDVPRRARLRVQVGHGVDARHARLHGHDPVHRKYHHDRLTFRLLYAFSENFVLPLSHDEVVHGKGSLLDRMPGDDWQSSPTFARFTATCWLTRARSSSSWAASSGSGGSGITTGASTGICSASPRPRGHERLVSDLNQLYRREPALHELDADPAGFAWIDAPTRSRAWCRSCDEPATPATSCSSSATSRPSRARLSGRRPAARLLPRADQQ